MRGEKSPFTEPIRAETTARPARDGRFGVIPCLTAPPSRYAWAWCKEVIVTVHLPPRIERIVKEAVRSGQYRSAEDVLSEAVSVWQARQAATETTVDERQAAIERLKNFAKTHQLSLGGMTIKQLRDEACP